MSHHGNDMPNFLQEYGKMFKNKNPNFLADALLQVNKEEKLGATNEFPAGKLDENDEGGIKFGCAIHEGKLILNFGEKPIKWIGFKKEEAKDLGEYLIQKASEI